MNLKQGDKSNQVREWQEFLNRFQNENLQADGEFGPKTHQATVRFQVSQNLRDDGIVGPGTYAAAVKHGFVGGGTSKPVVTGKKILISAGHSTVTPRDPGAVGNGFTESYLALELRDLVGDLLLEKGINVVEDGVDGQSLPLKKAIDLIRTEKPSVAVEFHWNAGPPTATGIEVLSKPVHKTLAQGLAGAISSATNLALRGDRGWKADNSGQHHRLAFCEAGGLIVEVCFISSKVDMAAYTSTKGHVAANIAEVLSKV